MKKSVVFKSLLICMLAVCFASCASIPKKVQKGDTLVIGYVSVASILNNSDNREFGGRDQTITRNIEVTIENVKNNEKRVVYTDKNGYLFITGLKAHEPYRITKVLFKVNGNAGSSTTWVNLYNTESFIPYENAVVNIGCTKYIFNQKINQVTYETKDHFRMRSVFKEVSEGSEWADAKIYDQCGL